MKDILIRAGKTFLQATLAVLIVSLNNGIDITNKEAVMSILIGALSAGISALMNYIISLLNQKVK